MPADVATALAAPSRRPTVVILGAPRGVFVVSVFAFAPLLAGCYATKVVRSTDLKADAPAPGLMVSTIIETSVPNTSNGGTLGVLEGVLALVNNAELD